MDVVDLPLEQIIPYARNPRRNEQAIATVAASIQEFGWRQPIVVDEAMVVLAGHTRLGAARKLGFKTAPIPVNDTPDRGPLFKRNTLITCHNKIFGSHGYFAFTPFGETI